MYASYPCPLIDKSIMGLGAQGGAVADGDGGRKIEGGKGGAVSTETGMLRDVDVSGLLESRRAEGANQILDALHSHLLRVPAHPGLFILQGYFACMCFCEECACRCNLSRCCYGCCGCCGCVDSVVGLWLEIQYTVEPACESMTMHIHERVHINV